MHKKMCPVVHFEMPYEDAGRVSKFYHQTFGWEMNKLGPEIGDYVLAGTDEADANGMLKETNRINGGFYPKGLGIPGQPSVVIAVEDIKAAMERVKTGGGEILGEVMPIPGIGQYVPFVDTESNRVGLLQPVDPM